MKKVKKGITDTSLSELTETIIEGIRIKKGEGITGLDLTHLNTSICNAFIIANGSSSVQVKAIAESVEDQVRDLHQRKPYHREGFENSHWILLDYGSIIVHIFLKNYRDFYDLEGLWADGHRTDYST
jgi:ribosome-associated protein